MVSPSVRIFAGLALVVRMTLFGCPRAWCLLIVGPPRQWRLACLATVARSPSSAARRPRRTLLNNCTPNCLHHTRFQVRTATLVHAATNNVYFDELLVADARCVDFGHCQIGSQTSCDEAAADLGYSRTYHVWMINSRNWTTIGTT